MNRNYIGSCYAEPCDTVRMKGAPLPPTDDGIALGFRLAHDSDSQVIRGSIFGDEARVARAAVRGVIEPASCDITGLDLLGLGFRLTRDEEAT